MAATTTLKLPDSLKARIAPLAKAAGKTPHAWMVAALEERAVLAEARRAFVADSLAAERATALKGKAWRAQDVHRYILASAAGKSARRPRPVKW